MSSNSKNNYKAPALDKGLDILEYLSLRSTPLSQTEIAEGISRTTNEIYRMLVCLEARGYIIREEISGKYKLSLKLYNLSHRHSPVDEIFKASQYPMSKLAKTTNQSCHLGVIYQNQLMVIHQSKSPGPISLSVEEGSLFSLILTASGRTLLAFMDDEQCLKLFAQNETYQNFTQPEQKEFLALLQKIRNQGFYAKTSEVTEGVTDVVVPIGNAQTSVYASLAVSILTTQIDKTISLNEIVRDTQKTAHQINDRLGMADKK